MLVTIKEGVTPELVQHKGQEFNYVLEGSLRVIVGEKEYYLKTGDSIYFDATLPHAQIAMEKGSPLPYRNTEIALNLMNIKV